jgi:low affinity Fe/Cu permease
MKVGLSERIARRVTDWAGSSLAFMLAAGVVVVWIVSGPIFGYSNTWQLVINTGTTIVTFLMVFLIQRAQNKDAHAMHLKLNELVAAIDGASSRLLNVEDLSEEDLATLHQHYKALASLAAKEQKLTHSHSIEEASGRHHRKQYWRERRLHEAKETHTVRNDVKQAAGAAETEMPLKDLPSPAGSAE